MTVVAIRCEACQGTRQIFDYDYETEECRSYRACPVCDPDGKERPPQDHDKDARHAIEGASDDA